MKGTHVMTSEDRTLTWKNMTAAVARSRSARYPLALLLLLELYNHGFIPAYLATQKGIESKAIADNAALKQLAEAELTEWKAITETEIAAYAARKQRADTRKATADAQKSDAERITAREVARNAEQKARAEAEAQSLEALLRRQQVLAEAEVAKQAERRKRAEAGLASEEAKSQQYGLTVLKRLNQ